MMRGGLHAMRMLLTGTLLLLAPAAAAQTGDAATVDGRTLTVHTWPPVAVTVHPDLTYAGTQKVGLGSADAELHVFVEAGADSVVRRLYWFQVEQVRPASTHRYDYSDMPGRLQQAGLAFLFDTRFGEAYAFSNVGREGDTATMLRILQAAGYRMPEEMMRIRMVTLDDARRRELLIIYLEDLAAHDLTAAALQDDPAAWERAQDGLRRRAVAGMTLRSR